MTQRMNRRKALAVGSAALATTWTGVTKRLSAGSTLEQVNLGFIACQGQAGFSFGGCEQENIVAICDVDTNNLGSRKASLNKSEISTYADFRKLIDDAGKLKLDAVVIATPDHVHAPAAYRALQANLHVYCEKPLTHTVHEARTLAKLAEEKNRVTQMGTQIHAGDNYRRVVELLNAGAIGNVTKAHAWQGGSWSNGRYQAATKPDTLDWDLWLGPAAERPYSSGLHPFHWRRFWDFGTGTLGDMGCHIIDLAFWGLDLKHPTSVESAGPEDHPVGAPAWQSVTWEFPTRGERPPVTLTWDHHDKRPALFHTIIKEHQVPLDKWGIGVIFVGDKGMLAATYGSHVLLPKDQFKDYKRPEQSIAKSQGHHREWLNAIRAGKPTTTCNFTYSGALTEAVLLGTVAYRVGKKLEWDSANLKATNCPEADKFLRKEYRKGWEVG